MKKHIYKVVFTSLFICVFIVSFCLPSFAKRVDDIQSFQTSDVVYNFNLNTAELNLGISSSDYFSSAFIGFLGSPSSSSVGQTPLVCALYFSASYDSNFGSSVPLGSSTCFWELPVYCEFLSSISTFFTIPQFKNVSGQTIYFKYYAFTFNVDGSVLTSYHSSTVPISSNSSYRIHSPSVSWSNVLIHFNHYNGNGNSFVFSDSFFDSVNNRSYFPVQASLTSVGLGFNGSTPSSGLSPNIQIFSQFLGGGHEFVFFPCLGTVQGFGALFTDTFSDYGLDMLYDRIAFNFTLDDSIISDSLGYESVVSSVPPFGGSSTSSGTLTPVYDSNGNIVNYNFDITTDNTDIINALNQSPVDSPLSISDSSASDFESAVSDLPTIQDSDLNSVFNSYGFDSNNSAISWIYSLINTIFTGNAKIFSVLLSFMVLSLLMLLLNKRGQ